MHQHNDGRLNITAARSPNELGYDTLFKLLAWSIGHKRPVTCDPAEIGDSEPLYPRSIVSSIEVL